MWADGEEHTIGLPVRNDSVRVVHVFDVVTGCNCRPVAPNTFTLQPGETRDIRLTITDIKRPEYVGRAHPIRIELRPVADGQLVPAWIVHGVVRPRIETDTTAIMFGESNRAGEPPVSRAVTVTLPFSGTLSAKLAPEIADVEVRPGATSSRWTVIVSPRTNRPPGAFRATLKLTNTPPGGTSVFALDLPVEGILLEGQR